MRYHKDELPLTHPSEDEVFSVSVNFVVGKKLDAMIAQTTKLDGLTRGALIRKAVWEYCKEKM